MSTTQAEGAAAEELASTFLRRHGLKTIARNFRVRGGEIDLICLDGATIVFVEVRLRRNRNFGGAAASITATKQARVILAARHWLVRHPRHNSSPCRFDCVLLDGEQIEWLRAAFCDG